MAGRAAHASDRMDVVCHMLALYLPFLPVASREAYQIEACTVQEVKADRHDLLKMNGRGAGIDDFHGSCDDIGLLEYAVEKYYLDIADFIGQSNFQCINCVFGSGKYTRKSI